jgi:putative transposase
MMSPLVRRTWAPIGHTPVIKRKARSHEKITAIAAVCTRPSGRNPWMYFRLLAPNENLNSASCVAFLEQLLVNIRGPVIMVWDGLQAHRSKKVKRFVAKHPRLELVPLPPYAPELNPSEYVWGHLKRNGLANFAPRTTDELHAKAKREVCRIRTSRDLLRSLLRHCPLKFDSPRKLRRRQ